MNFHETRFPTALSFGARGGPERRTDIVTLANGFEERNTPWQDSRRRYDAGTGLRAMDDIDQLIAFFEARQGPLYGFRWKDWADYKSSLPSKSIAFSDQVIGLGDGVRRSFQIYKIYRSGEVSYRRTITKPVQGTVRAGVQGTETSEISQFSVDFTTGIITFDRPPEDGLEVTAGYEFDVPARFDTDRIEASIATFEAGEVPDVPVIEVRVA